MSAAGVIEARRLWERRRRADPPALAGQSFQDLFLWRDFFRYRFEEIGGSLCVFAEGDGGVFLYGPPIGAWDRTVLETCLCRMRGPAARVEQIDAARAVRFPSAGFRVSLKGFEYVYERRRIAELRGNALKSQRWAANACGRRHPCRVRAFMPSMREACLALYDHWAAGRTVRRPEDAVYRQMLADSRRAHRTAMTHAEDLDMAGLVVEIDGRIRAYTLGFPLDTETFCVAMEVADPACTGLAAFIFREFCRDPRLRPYPYINAMDDCGLPNIARVKRAFRPLRRLPVYVAVPEERRP